MIDHRPTLFNRKTGKFHYIDNGEPVDNDESRLVAAYVVGTEENTDTPAREEAFNKIMGVSIYLSRVALDAQKALAERDEEYKRWCNNKRGEMPKPLLIGGLLAAHMVEASNMLREIAKEHK